MISNFAYNLSIFVSGVFLGLRLGLGFSILLFFFCCRWVKRNLLLSSWKVSISAIHNSVSIDSWCVSSFATSENLLSWIRVINMFATAIRYIARKPKPKMKPIELKTPPEQTQTITRVIFNILKEHGPLTIADTWEHVKEVGLKGLTSKRHMKIVMRWMKERQKVRQICNHVGPHKQFLYTTWFTKPKS